MYVASFMRNSPNGQILGQPNTGIPRRALWPLVALVAVAHAALLLDTSALIHNTDAQTSVSPSALLSTRTDSAPDATAQSAQSPTAIRWVAVAPAPAAAKPATPVRNTTRPAPPPQAQPPAPTPEAAQPTPPLGEAPTPPTTDNTAEAVVAAAGDTVLEPQPLPIAPSQTRLVYDITGQVKGRNVFAEGVFEWTVQDGRYDAVLAIRMPLLGSRTQTSTGRIGPLGLMPERFGERQRDEAATHFDYEGQRVRFSRNRPDAPLAPGTQDRLSVILQLAAQLQAQPLETGQSVEVPVASSREVALWRWTVGEMLTLDLPQGSVLARHLTRAALDERDQTIELWMAPSLQYLPARIRISQSNGDWLDQRLVLPP
ncbi:MAG: hypothetical protein RJB34_168 [Pseudomonadota bacterium]